MLIAAIFRAACVIAALLPLSLLRALGLGVAWCWFYLLPIRRAVVLANLAAAFPDLPRRRRWQMAREVFAFQGQCAWEMLAWRKLLRPQAPWRFADLSGLRAATRGGAIAVTGHLGAWELALATAAVQGLPVTVFSRHLRHRGLDRAWSAVRRRLGIEIIYEDEGLTAVGAALRAQRVLVVAIDQHSPERRAVVCDFLGHPARTSPLAATLALRYQVPLLLVHTHRDPQGIHHIAWQHVDTDRESSTCVSERIQALTMQCCQALTTPVLHYPTQWLWLHRRWKDHTGRALFGPQRRQRRHGSAAHS